MNYRIAEKEGILKANIDELDVKKLYDIFLLNANRVLYVYKNGEVFGIISALDFFRARWKGKETVKEFLNCCFTFLEKDDCNEVEKVFNEKSFNSLPVIQNGDVVKEYLRDSEKKEIRAEITADFSFFEAVTKECVISRYDTQVFVLDSILPEWRGKIREIFKNTCGRIRIYDSIKYSELKEMCSEGHTIVYTFGGANYWLYRVCCIEGIECKYFYDDLFYLAQKIKGNMNAITMYYGESSFLESGETYFDNEVIKKSKVLKNTEVLWDEDEACHVCNSWDKIQAEVLFTLTDLSGNHYVRMGDRMIPAIALFSQMSAMESMDEDVAFNIVPSLQKKDVMCFVIGNAEEEYDVYCAEYGVENWRELCAHSDRTKKHIFYGCEQAEPGELEKEVSKWPVIYDGGYLQYADKLGPLVNYLGGERYTCGNTGTEMRKIDMFGACIVAGPLVSDSYTVASFLRRRMRDDIAVKNHGAHWMSVNYAMRKCKYRPGDIAIVFAKNRKPYDIMGIPVYSILDAFLKVEDLYSNIWDALYHCNGNVMSRIADKLYDILNENSAFDSDVPSGEEFVLATKIKREVEIPKGLKQWLTEVKQYKKIDGGKTGAIVMNCNPFTRGHRYLVEKALECVETLYIFVLEEDKSFFKFEDRIQMVRLGVADLESVVVVPSGKYVISADTLPGYFEKEENPDIEFDATQDLEFFSKVIAKEFGISVRFAGEEPKDKFTNRYNQFMKVLLPDYGVQFCEIKRKELSGEVISASRVRRALKEKEYQTVKELVLPQVYQYLTEAGYVSE